MRKLFLASVMALTFSSAMAASPIPTLEAQIRDTMREPDSAKFRYVYVVPGLDSNTHTARLCGQVNTKNAYGGYTGFLPFIAHFDPRTSLLTSHPYPDALGVSKDFVTTALMDQSILLETCNQLPR